MEKKFTSSELNLAELNPFKLIGDDWMLITAEKDGKVNTMTASWGGLGVLWNMNVAYIFVRKSRYTKEFLDAAEGFSLSFFDHKAFAKKLGYLGSVSGRDEDKIAAAELSVVRADGVPYFAEAKQVLICRKLFCQFMPKENFLDPSIIKKFYNDNDFHFLYVGEIKSLIQA